MAWTIEFDTEAARDFRKLDSSAQRQIRRYLRERIVTDEDPRRFGKPLSGDLAGLWRYRVADFRLVCRIEDDRVVVLFLAAGHRRNVYEP